MIWIVAAFCLALTVGAVAQAQAQKNLADEANQSENAARVFREIMDTPDKGIPQELLDGAECVAVFPSVFKAGFIFGGRGGRGVASCRTAVGWSAPAFFTLGGGSFGLQIGVVSARCEARVVRVERQGALKGIGAAFESIEFHRIAAHPSEV